MAVEAGDAQPRSPKGRVAQRPRRPYRAFWLYIAASWALSTAAGDEGAARAEAMARDAAEAARALTWRPRPGATTPAITALAGDATAQGVLAAGFLGTLNLRGRRFEERCGALLGGLAVGDPPMFERCLHDLGEFLGFEAYHPAGEAQPDSVWRDGDRTWLIFEAKTDANPATEIPPRDVRQALTHKTWVETQMGWAPAGYSATYLICDRTTVDRTAAALAGPLFVVKRREVVAIAEQTVACYRALRAIAPGIAAEELAKGFTREFATRQLDVNSLTLRLNGKAVSQLRLVG